MQPDTTDPATTVEACFPGYPPKKDAAAPMPGMTWDDVMLGLARQAEAHAALRGAADRLLTALHSRPMSDAMYQHIVPAVVELQDALKR